MTPIFLCGVLQRCRKNAFCLSGGGLPKDVVGIKITKKLIKKL